MNDQFCLSHAQIIGRSHLLAGKNSQDAIYVSTLEVDGKKVYFGIICDGCSEGENSEVGAKLAASFLGCQIEILVKSKVALSKIPPVLHKRLVVFMKKILGRISFDTPRARVNYIKDNLLFTVLGFICTENETIIFVQGDGVWVVNDEVTYRNENDMPMYIGYELVDRRYLSSSASELPQCFDVINISTGDFNRFAIASDSLANELEMISAIWGNEKTFTLQKKVNVWSLVEHKFSDDLSIIVLEKK